MRLSRLIALAVLPVLWSCAGARPPEAKTAQPAPSGGTTAAISPTDLKARISIFADDSMLGRRAGTVGNVRGNAYISAEAGRLGLKPAGDSGSFLQRVPLVSYSLDSAGATLRAGSGTLAPFADYYPYQPIFAVPARPIAGAPIVYLGTIADSASFPSRDDLRGKLVVFRSQATGNSLGAPDLSAPGRLGLIAGIAITNIDPLLARFATSFRSPKLEIKGAIQAPPGATQPRFLFVPTGAISKVFGKPLDARHPGDTAPPLQGEVAYVGTELPATNVVAVLEGTDPALRGEYVALGAHNDAIGIVPPVSHDSLRAYNTVIRPRGANDTPRDPTAEETGRIQARRDSLRTQHPARVDSIVNGADDDGS